MSEEAKSLQARSEAGISDLVYAHLISYRRKGGVKRVALAPKEC